jgi:hypothetical protein
MKDVQASEEVSSSQKRRSQTLKQYFFHFLWVTETGSSSTTTKINADPDPQHNF